MVDDSTLETGQYHITRVLGRGGMAEVYEGSYTGAAGFERTICIKRILPHAASDPEFREMFVKEAKLAGKLRHANVVQVFDCLELGEEIALIMELVDGGDLAQLVEALAGKPMSAELVAHVAGAVLAGLAYAHELHIVHRDISPHNILVSRHGEVKIADFGIAKAIVTHATRTGKLKGKLAYMSPEQLGGKGVDHRTDLYSAGLVLYELITGTRFHEKTTTQQQLIQSIIEAKRPKLDGVDPALGEVIEKLLDPDPRERYQSAEEALVALPPWRSVGPLGARALGRLVRTIRGDAGEALPVGIAAVADPEPPEPTEILVCNDIAEPIGRVLDLAPTIEMNAIPPELAVRAPGSGDSPDTIETDAIVGGPEPHGERKRMPRAFVVSAAVLVILCSGLGIGVLIHVLLRCG